jgi:hypothetical protein
MTTLFDYLDAYVYAYLAAGELGQPLDLPALAYGGAHDPALVTPAEGLETLFGGLDADTWVAAGEPPPPVDAASSPAAPAATEAAGSPADAWLSGSEWSGEAEVGGASLTGGTVDTSGGGNDVYSVDGEVLDLPN